MNGISGPCPTKKNPITQEEKTESEKGQFSGRSVTECSTETELNPRSHIQLDDNFFLVEREGAGGLIHISVEELAKEAKKASTDAASESDIDRKIGVFLDTKNETSASIKENENDIGSLSYLIELIKKSKSKPKVQESYIEKLFTSKTEAEWKKYLLKEVYGITDSSEVGNMQWSHDKTEALKSFLYLVSKYAAIVVTSISELYDFVSALIEEKRPEGLDSLYKVAIT